MVEFVDKLTRSVEKIRFLDAPRRSRKLSFWAQLVRNLVHSRKLKLLLKLRKIAIEPWNADAIDADCVGPEFFCRNDECRESPDFGGYGIDVCGRWYRWAMVTQEGLGVME
jgi:hypothetical protein